VLIGLVGRRKGAWSVDWVSNNPCPPEPKGIPTLSEAVEQAAQLTAQHYAGYAAIPGAELQLAIYPWDDYKGGLVLEIRGWPGELTAQDLDATCTAVHGSKFEDIAAGVEQLHFDEPGHPMFRMAMPISDLQLPQP
jgi:hypothetical protein